MEQGPPPDSGLPAHLDVALHVCPPPYEGLTAFPLTAGRSEPPLGALVCATGGSVLGTLEQLAVAIHRWPWVAPCVGLGLTRFGGHLNNPVMFGGEVSNEQGQAERVATGTAGV